MQASREKGSLQTYWRPVHSEGRCFAKAFLLCCLYAAGVGVSGSPHGDAEGKTWTIEAVMPEHPAPAESYLCMRVDLPEMNSLKLTGIEPLSQEALVHHMLLFGCSARTEETGVWSCQGHGVCPNGGTQQILYGWAKGAPAMHLPEGVGYTVGAGTKIDNLVLQVHFAVERPKQDSSGIKVSLTDSQVPFSAGMMMFASSFQIPPKQEKHLVPNQCCYSGFEPAHGFAFRVHTHMLGRSVYMDEVLKDGNRQRVVEHSPQLPQGFTAVSKIIFWPGQRLEATCQFNSMERDDITWAGATHHHEMCNLYMITWSEMPVFLNCYDSFTSMDYHGAGGVPQTGALLPEDSRFWQPLQYLAGGVDENHKKANAEGWGQIAGVAKGHHGSIWIFSRGSRVWDAGSFRGSRNEEITYTDPIKQKTVFQLDQDTGAVLSSWGSETFFMPHMITIDRWGDVWLTDVGLHQVFKYSPSGTLLLTIGERLKPGTGKSFCKPTQVAISNNGSVYVSDGYCNARVAQFTSEGEHVTDFMLVEGTMNVPHSLVLHECSDRLSVADRENAKVHQFELSTRKHTGSWDLRKEGLVYGLAMGPYGTLFALTWDRDNSAEGGSRLLLLHGDPSAGVDEQWLLNGVEAPHDLTAIAAPLRLAGRDRPMAFVIGETRASQSQLHKFLLMPAGTGNLSSTDGLLTSASEQWKAVLEASTFSQQEIPPEIVAAKTADVQHTQVLTDEDVSAFGHHAHPGDDACARGRGCRDAQDKAIGMHPRVGHSKTAVDIVPQLGAALIIAAALYFVYFRCSQSY